MARNSRRVARECVVQALYQWSITKQEPSQIKDSFIENYNLSGTHRDYFLSLIDAIPAHTDELNKLLAPHLNRSPRQVDLIDQAILLLGAYELNYDHTIPTKVVLNESIEIAKRFCSENSYQYVNGVLDKVARAVRNDIQSSE